jgi:hypothetical protein
MAGVRSAVIVEAARGDRDEREDGVGCGAAGQARDLEVGDDEAVGDFGGNPQYPGGGVRVVEHRSQRGLKRLLCQVVEVLPGGHS